MVEKKIENNLKDVNIEGDYNGGDTLNLDETAIREIRKPRIAEIFGLDARNHIANVAIDIANGKDAPNKDWGLEYSDLQEKFENLKCTQTYIKSFETSSQFFNVIDEMKESDAVSGGADTIRHIEGLITKLYLEFFDDYENGPRIHNAILGELVGCGYTTEQYYASDTLIFYTIRECGMFNEAK